MLKFRFARTLIVALTLLPFSSFAAEEKISDAEIKKNAGANASHANSNSTNASCEVSGGAKKDNASAYAFHA